MTARLGASLLAFREWLAWNGESVGDRAILAVTLGAALGLGALLGFGLACVAIAVLRTWL